MQMRVCKAGLAALAALLLAGCAAGYRAPPGAALGEQYAELTFELALTDMVGFGTATTQAFAIGEGPLEAEAQAVRIFTWAHKDPKTVLVPANRPLHVFARMTGLWGAPGITSSGSNWCRNVSQFTPRPNARYRVSQVGQETVACRLIILDAVTGQPPADLSALILTPPKPAS